VRRSGIVGDNFLCANVCECVLQPSHLTTKPAAPATQVKLEDRVEYVFNLKSVVCVCGPAFALATPARREAKTYCVAATERLSCPRYAPPLRLSPLSFRSTLSFGQTEAGLHVRRHGSNHMSGTFGAD
jgi:hypothetical protein